MSGQDGAPDGARDLRHPNPLSVTYGHLRTAEPGFGGAYLHLYRPAKIRVAHPQFPEGRVADGAEGAQVSKGIAVNEFDQAGGQPVAEHLLGLHAAGLQLAEGAGADDEVHAIVQDGGDDFGELFRVVAVVSVDENHNIGPVFRRAGCDVGHTPQAGRAVAGPQFIHHRSARRPGHFCRPVLAVVVANNDFPNQPRRDFAHHQGNAFFLVVSGDNDVDDGRAIGQGKFLFALVGRLKVNYECVLTSSG